MRQLMVGLGNPWPSPKMARHNLGTMVLEALAKQLDLEWSWWWSCWGWIAEEEELGFGFFLPRSFYNTSGWAVQRVMELHGLEAHQVLLLHDDLDLPPLCWSVLGGNHSDAGNRGVRGVRGSPVRRAAEDIRHRGLHTRAFGGCKLTHFATTSEKTRMVQGKKTMEKGCGFSGTWSQRSFGGTRFGLTQGTKEDGKTRRRVTGDRSSLQGIVCLLDVGPNNLF
ncbi:unnamed protein product [Durusdinium trenchii]|uniref:Peptidyl-tRNA hydrolase n=1 Tax=Durusdinium trenchii TaxID=1381693 RepID=A0ABP0L8M0_9DINO